MAILGVGPFSAYQSIAAAMMYAGPGDTIVLEGDYSNENADVRHNGMTITGGAASVDITLRLAPGVTSIVLAGLAPINLVDSSDGNAVVGNDGDNLITVTGGADAVDGGLGNDRLVVDFALAIGAVTGDSTSNFTEAGGGARMVTVTAGTIEHFTVLTGNGADTITTANGDDIIMTGNGAATVSAGQGANFIVGGADADTITALDGGNRIDAGHGANTVTTGGGNDTIATGSGADIIVSGAGEDRITVRGGTDTVDAGADLDRLVVDYAAVITNVSGGVTSGNLSTGYTGSVASLAGETVNFVGVEAFSITTGSGNDTLTSADAADVLYSGSGDDLMWAGGGVDFLQGNLGNDVMFAGAGNDDARGGQGNDTISGEDGDDILYGALGNDLLIGGNDADTLLGGDGNDDLQGNLGDDLLEGNAGNDELRGGQGSDFLSGGNGDDTLLGALGNDFVVGGEGADQFLFTTALGIDNVDVVFDFEHGVDLIVLSKEIFTAFDGASVVTLGDYLRHDTGASSLFYDVDGLGGQDEILFGYIGVNVALTSDDFLLI